MADIPVEGKKTAPAQSNVPDVWHSFRGEMDRLFDGFGFPSLRRVFDMEPSWRPASTFNFSVPAIDMSEDDKAYKISAELPGIDAKDIDMSVSGDFSRLRRRGTRRLDRAKKSDFRFCLSRRSGGRRLAIRLTRSLSWRFSPKPSRST
jgi:HSP20 family protein